MSDTRDNESRREVCLYETNAGQLTLTCEASGLAYTGIECVETSDSHDDADAIASGDTAEWTIDRVAYDADHGNLVAVWADGKWSLQANPGVAAQRYLGLRQ